MKSKLAWMLLAAFVFANISSIAYAGGSCSGGSGGSGTSSSKPEAEKPVSAY